MMTLAVMMRVVRMLVVSQFLEDVLHVG